jgi:hypothetical protein
VKTTIGEPVELALDVYAYAVDKGFTNVVLLPHVWIVKVTHLTPLVITDEDVTIPQNY